MIFSEGSSRSSIKTYSPFPLFADPFISSAEAPLPIPMECMRAYLLLLPIILRIFLVSDTSPSVNKKICLAYPSFGFSVNRPDKGAYIYVPPKSADICSTVPTAVSIDLLSYILLSLNNFTYFEPKLMTLKNESFGKLLMNNISASFAFYILFPPIDPLRSNKKMYSPFADSISPYKVLPQIDALYASLTLSEQNFGMKESIAVELLSLLPKTQLGSSYLSVVQLNIKSLFGRQAFVNESRCSVQLSFCLITVNLWELESKKLTFRVVLRLIWKLQQKSTSTFGAPYGLQAIRSCFLGQALRKRGVTEAGIFSSQKVLQLSDNSCFELKLTAPQRKQDVLLERNIRQSHCIASTFLFLT